MSEPLLLAKSPVDKSAPRFEETLGGHTARTIESFDILFGPSPQQPTQLTERWLAFFGLSAACIDSFLANGRVACGVHDTGKGTLPFREMLLGRNVLQPMRHEHLSGLFLWLPEVARWLESIPHVDRRIVFSAVVGHHLRCRKADFAQPLHADIKSFQVFTEGIAEGFRSLGDHVGVAFRPQSPPFSQTRWTFDGRGGFDLRELREHILRDLQRFPRRESMRDPGLPKLLMAVRAALILADSSGSGLVREHKDLRTWLESAFGQRLGGNDIAEQIITRRVRQIEATKGRFQWGKFQEATETLGQRALLLAPCGSGKTLAAWRWIKARLQEQPMARVIFLYPTRATATEGFRDYVSWAPETDGSLLTGTAAFELDGMFAGIDDERAGKDFSTEDRLYALAFWHRRVFSATVDQFLGFMQQIYRSVCLLPLLADSVVVIDEVHSFDRALFSALKVFLKNFNVPVLCMTASLPSVRRKELEEECGLEVFPRTMEDFPDLEAAAAMPRYRVNRLGSEEEAVAVSLEARDSGRRVLWVVNTVSRCQRLAKELGALCYHSRFKLEDRKERHREIIDAFRNTEGGILAVTTQVCEMSLDLDADVLISEMSPITAMIQRMGRCNRHAVPGSGKLGDVFFYQPENEMPYSSEDLGGSEEFLKILASQTANQTMLEELLERLGPADHEPERYAAFLENGPWAAAREAALRDTGDFSVTAILDEDIRRYFDLKSTKNPTDGLYLPVPRKFARQHPRLGRFPEVAESSHYDPMFGFFDHPLEVIL